MNIVDTIKMAYTTLVTSKLQSSLTILGIVIGNASVIAMIEIGEAGKKLAAQQFESLGTNALFVNPASNDARNNSFDFPKTLILEDAKAIASQVQAVAKVAPQINLQQLITYQNKNTNKSIVGTTPEFLLVRNFDVARGRFITELDLKRSNKVVILGSDLAKRLFGSQEPIGKQLWIKNVNFQVVGVMESKGSLIGINQDEIAYIPLTTMANRIIGRTSPYGLEVNTISVSAKDQDSIEAAQFQIENLLRRRHKIINENDFEISSQKNILKTVNTITTGLSLMNTTIAAISLFVAGLGIMNIMLVTVNNRTQEIGIRKALGARKKDILIQFLIEALLLCASGSVLGILLSVNGILLVNIFTPLQPTLSPVTLLISLTISGSMGLFFGIVPAQRAANLDPIIALKNN